MFSKIKTQAGRSFVGVKSFYYFLSNANKVKAYEFSCEMYSQILG